MKYLLAFVLFLVASVNVAAEEYPDEVWIYTHDHLYFLQSCWVVVEQPDFLGGYCFGQFNGAPAPSVLPTNKTFTPMEVNFSSAAGSPGGVSFLDTSMDCVLFDKVYHSDPNSDVHWNEYMVQCGDYIFVDNFEDPYGSP